VVFVDDTISDAVSSIVDELDAALDKDADWTDEDARGTSAFQCLPNLVKPSVLAAIQMERGDAPNRFEAIPHFESDEAYEWMEDFIETARDDGVRGRLSDAIRERKPFRHFQDVLRDDRRLEQQWRAFESARQHEAMIEWLHSIGIEPANPAETIYDLPPLPDLRKIMFAELRRFVRLARDLPGVQRIALIGSLATNKEFPKDVDVLVTITDDCNLTELARLGRELNGHLTANQAGADVFLANSAGNYLGRTCPWKNCGPGNRASCDAQHCGQRHYLHDDLTAIRLPPKLIAHPPVLLWPDVAALADVPLDVREQLTDLLSQDPDR
jgi:predicted nucleotidyltransferase